MSEDIGEYNLFNMERLPQKMERRILLQKLEKRLDTIQYSDVEAEEKAI